jgi:uncharacterized protein (TIGR03437 family)
VSIVTAQVEWRPVGNTLVAAGLADAASGAIDRVWYSHDGNVLHARTSAGAVYAFVDPAEEGATQWRRVNAAAPITVSLIAGASLPESGARLVGSSAASPNRYAWARSVYRSNDEGRSWTDVTRFRGVSVIGEGLSDLAVSPVNEEEIVAATRSGVWRSVDGGLSWSGLNNGLPNLPVRRLLGLRPMRVEMADGEAVWRPGGQHGAWAPVQPDVLAAERARRIRMEASLGGIPVSADASAGDWVYAATGGRIWVSADRGGSWRASPVPMAGAVTRIISFEQEPRTALAIAGGRLMRTVNGGLFWDDVTGGINGPVRGVAGDFESGSVYAASAAGLFRANVDLLRAAPVPAWEPMQAGLPTAGAMDVMVDEGGNQLYVALDGHGVWAALAPHRFGNPRVLNAADRSTGSAAAPGTLLSVLGALVTRAGANGIAAPVLAASGGESQIQVPFEAEGARLDLRLWPEGTGAAFSRPMPLRPVSPAIFVDPDGAPMLLDADRGVLLDASLPARAGSRIQILATGLGRVTPAWPTGLAAPTDAPPRVVAPVRVLVDRVPVQVTRATLAPGYIGFYLVEVQLPDIVDNGPAELIVEAAGQMSRPVTLHLVQ